MKIKKVLIGILLLLVGAAIGGYFYYSNEIKTVVDSNSTDKELIVINPGTSRVDIVKKLAEDGFIKNEIVGIDYVYVNNLNLQAGEYHISKSQSLEEILNHIHEGEVKKKEEIKVTFIEGKRIPDYAKVISEKFPNYTYEEVIAKFKDRDYAKKLIASHSILDDEILDSEIYYPLEGYLYPDTYSFFTDATLEDIIEKLVTTMEFKLKDLRPNIEEKGLTYHELLSAASIIEMEGTNASNRANVAQVIYKRLAIGMNLGMDVTTYYAVQKEMKDVLTKQDLASTSKYNTRLATNKGYPVGPICSPSMESIRAALNPSDTNYIYFYASKSGVIKFTDNYSEFLQFIREG